uniref:Uncharacterized protein n=2 Tax=Avena sativa TaxID=4498 RepID=A0ACD5VDK2_AVESA
MATFNNIEISLESELTDGAISFDRLEQITDNFSQERKLGTAEPRRVYKGILEDGGVVAVKKHKANAPGTHNREAYITKVTSLMELNHKNIARLLAFCYEKRDGTTQHLGRPRITKNIETLLCYEYVHKGSLEKNLFDDTDSNLDWDTRFKIIKGISEGVQYLHNLPDAIIHLDINPQNILLDHNNVPKITNFLNSRLVNKNKTRVDTVTAMGSMGYRAPENLSRGQISKRVDIFSLGLIILQITTRVKNYPIVDQEYAETYIDSVTDQWCDEDEINQRIMTEYPDLPDDNRDQLRRCIQIGLDCVHTTQDKRPKIDEIVKTLNGQ